MASTTIPGGTTQTTRITLSGTDTLTVDTGGTLSVSATAQSVRFNSPTTNGSITNNGTIENTAAGGRAIRVEAGVGSTFTATIQNNGTISSSDDAIQIAAGVVTAGQLTIGNTGTITSASGQALDLAGGTGSFTADITDSGTLTALTSDAIRFGGIGNLTTSGVINGGSSPAFSVGADGVQYEANASGKVTVQAGGTISGDSRGINAGLNTTVEVENNGTIIGRNGSGVGLDGTGTVTNDGTISGRFSNSPGSDINGSTVGQVNGGGPDGINDGDGDGIDIRGRATIVNRGLIEGTGAGGTGSDGRPNTSEGIAAGGGSIANQAKGSIVGADHGILVDDGATGNAPFATVITNEGSIAGTTSYGIRLIGNQADQVSNSGTISGGGDTAMLLGDGSDTLTIANGSSITGVSSGEGGTDLLDYRPWTSTGVTVNLATGLATGTGGVAGFEDVTGSDQNDSLTGNAGDNRLDGGAGADSLIGGLGADTLLGGEGADTLVSGNTVDIVRGEGGDDVIRVAGGANTADGGTGDDVVIVGAGAGDSLAGGDGLDILAFDVNGNVTFTDLGDGNYGMSGAGVGASTVSGFEGVRLGDGSIVNFGPFTYAVCFAEGTRILTDRGEVPVEDLQGGDLVATLGLQGAPVTPVLWVGRRRVMLAGHPNAAALAPVRIKAGALGEATPARDLLVSGDHCLYLDGALVPARLLVNGTTIVAERGVAEVMYFHIELDRHDVLIAEGAAAESWLDCGNRAWFSNAPVAMLRVDGTPDAYATTSPTPCAPAVLAGPRLGLIRDAIALQDAGRVARRAA